MKLLSLLIAPFFSSLLVIPAALAARNCDISQAKLNLPSDQTALVLPSESVPSYIAVAFGVQNYTCNPASNTYKSVGAVAELFDISCLYNTPEFSTIQKTFFSVWSKMDSSITIQDIIASYKGSQAAVFGQHFFISNSTESPGSATPIPVWDFSSASNDPNVNPFFIGVKTGDLPAPTGPDDVDWLSLKNAGGELADYVYRVDTKSGKPPASCASGPLQLSVKYTCKYWFYGGSAKVVI